VNDQAKQYILDEVANPNIRFLDLDSLVPEIDELYPEFWSGIIGDQHPYLKGLIATLTDDSSSLYLASGSSALKSSSASPVTDEGYAHLKLNRTFLSPKKVNGVITQQADFEEISIEKLIGYEKPHVLILGEAGCGKSTALKRLAERVARKVLENNQSLPTPIILRALDISSDDTSLAEKALSSTRELTVSGQPAVGVDQLQAGSVMLLIDALDEIGTRASLDVFAKALNEFRANYPRCPIIVTGRNYSYIQSLEALKDFRQFTIAPIGHKEATKIIKNLSRKKATIDKSKTREVVRQLEHIHGIELSPLLVTVFVSSTDSTRRDIPANITELFAKYTEELLGRWDSGKGAGQQYESNLKGLLLQRVAFKMHSQKQVSILKEDFQRYIENELAEVGQHEAKIDSLLDEIKRSGIFREFDGRIEFRHLLLQEFFAGRGIPDPKLISTLVLDEWWRRAIVFYFGANPGNESALRNLIGDESGKNPQQLFNVAITVGLAAQACYFIKVSPKMEIFAWVLNALGAARDVYLPGGKDGAGLPLHTFLMHYLVGRDGVAAECLGDVSYFTSIIEGEQDSEKKGLIAFWYLVGLIEANKLETAYGLIRKLHLNDARYYLGIHLGSFLAKNIRSTDKVNREWAKKIMDEVSPQVGPIRGQFLKEFKSQLVELRKGEIKELPEDVVDIQAEESDL
jgi:hypothetical protein